VANAVLKHSKAQGSGWIVFTTGWAFAVMSAVFVAIACGSRDAHINPAVTLGFAVATGKFAKVLPYSVAQMLGAFVGSVLVWIHFGPHWKATEDPELKRVCFCGVPAIRNFTANLPGEARPCFQRQVIGRAGDPGNDFPKREECEAAALPMCRRPKVPGWGSARSPSRTLLCPRLGAPHVLSG
jgi:hypothetical protein